MFNFSRKKSIYLTFFAITLFYFFESIQFAYFNVLAPAFLKQGVYTHHQVAALSAAYMYGIVFGLMLIVFLDRYSLRKNLLWAILGSVAGAFLLFSVQQYSLQWIARFVCGFFGGAFSFVGGIRIIALLFPAKFTFYMGLFLAAGTLGGLVCQYPLLVAVKVFGISGAMAFVAFFGLLVMIFNLFYLHPNEDIASTSAQEQSSGNFWQTLFCIIKNYQNWLDCFMVILLDTPVSIMGTLWGMVILIHTFQLSSALSAWVIMGFFLGMLIGYPAWGVISDRLNQSKWVIFVGALASLLMILPMLLTHHLSVMILFLLFFGLGLFSSCQTLGFAWLTSNMRPDLIGRNSAFNSMLFMGANGGFKQFSAYLLSLAPLLGYSSGNNLLILIAGCMVLVVFYVLFRGKILNL